VTRAFFTLAIWLAACGGSGAKPVMGPPPIDGESEPDPRAGARSGGPGEEVTFTADDGVVLSGSYYAPEGAATACFVFVHQLSSTRGEWQPIIDPLRGSAHIVAFDMRGHGASTQGADGAAVAWKTFETADWEKVEGDVGKAMELLAGRGAGSACTLVGASIGSSAVLRYAGAHPDGVNALVLLSPGIAYRGVKTPDAARTSKAPVLIVHSQENGAADAAGALKGIWEDATPPVPVEIIADPGQAHGMKIVAGDPAILDRVVAFLREPRQ
jgi:pimeloyl-ACP methyl ester carboxylesterase